MEVTAMPPLQMWAAQQGKPNNPQDDNKETIDMTELFMTMLQSVSANPLQEGNIADSIRVIQDLVRTRASIEEGQRLKSMSDALQANNRLQSSTLVGKMGEFNAGEFQVRSGSIPGVAYEVPEGSNFKSLHAELFDASGRKLSQFEASPESGYHSLGEQLGRLPDGNYSIQAFGVTQDDQIRTVPAISTAPISRVFFKEGNIFIDSGGTVYPFDALKGLYPDPTASLPSMLQGLSAHA